MKKTYTVYFCDLCETEVSKLELNRIAAPCKVLGNNDLNAKTVLKEFEVCPACRDRYVKAVNENFATITVHDDEIHDVEFKKNYGRNAREGRDKKCYIPKIS